MEPPFVTCRHESCDRDAHRGANGRLGYCSKHYQRAKRHGNPDVVKPTPSPARDWIAAHTAYSGYDCLAWPFHVGSDGYGRAHGPDGRLSTASRLMCIASHGNPPTLRHEAAHRCGRGNRACVNPRHIYWATPQENQRDRAKHGTSNRGERQWQARLSEEKVRAIREDRSGVPQADVAAEFGIHQSHVSKIKSGQRWEWLDPVSR